MEIFFYLFAGFILISSIMVVISNNPVYSVLWLIFSFCNGSGLMILLGAEFVAMMLIVIYVGAVAVLFLFVIMMLDIRFLDNIASFRKNLGLSIFVGLVMFADLVLVIWLASSNNIALPASNFAIPSDITNTHAIGRVLYTEFILPFQVSGLILFVAMISCISLTISNRGSLVKRQTRRQNITKQNSRTKDNAILMINPELNQGVKEINYD
jgi:NADH-quinone oxidoreductase subunit J